MTVVVVVVKVVRVTFTSPAGQDHDALLLVLADHAQLVLPLPLHLPQQLGDKFNTGTGTAPLLSL